MATNTKPASLTGRERALIRNALKIAVEDGSIFGSAETDAAIAKINREIEAIEAKLV